MIAIIYARVSTEDQVKGYSLDSQVKECKKKAKELGATTILDPYIDEGISGSILDRPGLTAAREQVRLGGVSLFLCYDPDRLARNLSHQLIITEDIERHGTKLEFINFDWQNTPEGKLFYSMRGAIAEYEKEKIRERSMRGKREKAKQNKLTHNPQIYGYDYDKEKDTLIINEAEAEIVRLIYHWFVSNPDTGYHTIANRLTKMLPSPKGKPRWHKTTVRRMLTNYSYTGTLYLQRLDTTDVKNNKFRPDEEKVKVKIRPKEEWIPVKIPPIMDKATFNLAQDKIAKIRRNRPGLAIYDYLLSRLCICGKCGATIHGNLATNKSGEKVAYYVCSARNPGVKQMPKCELRYVRADEIETEVWDKIVEWISDSKSFAYEFKHEATNTNSYDMLFKEKRLIEDNINEIDKQRIKIIDLYQKELISENEVENKLTSFKNRLKNLIDNKINIEAQLEEQKSIEIDKKQIEELFGQFKNKLNEMEFEERRALTNLLINEVVVYDNQIVVKVKVPF